MKNSVQEGKAITVTVAADVSSGDVGVHGSFVGIYANDALNGEENVLYIDGVFSLEKVADTEVVAVGAPMYFRPAAGVIGTAAEGDTFIGIATKASGNGTANVDIKLERSFSVVTPA